MEGSAVHLFLTLVGGAVLLGLFMLFGDLWGGKRPDIALAATLFVPVWLILSIVNMWIGVTSAGYSIREELPILAIVFGVPTASAAFTIWRLTRSYTL